MNQLPSDALVLFGATGDLAHKKIYPALQALLRRGQLDVPVIGVALSGWNLERLRERVRDSLKQHGDLDEQASAKLCSLLHYVDGDYKDKATFERLRRELGQAKRPLHYLAIPPSMFPTVVEGLGALAARTPRGSWSRSLSAATSPRRRRSTQSAQRVRRGRDLPHRPLPRQGAGTEPALLPLRQFVSRADLEPQLRAERADHHGREVRRRGPRRASTRRPARSATWCRITCSRSSPYLAMEPPVGHRREALRDEKVQVLRSIRPLTGRVSCAASSAAIGTRTAWRRIPRSRPSLRCSSIVDSWRWAGVPFYIRAGKRLPVTATEVMVELQPPAADVFERDRAAALQLRPLPTRPRRWRSQSARRPRSPATPWRGKRSNSLLQHQGRRDRRLRAADRRRHEGRRDAVRARRRRRGSWRIVDPILGCQSRCTSTSRAPGAR